jgi:dihydroxyacetone kinase-like predicted kinase
MHEIATIYFGKDSTAGQAQSLAQNVSNLYPELKVEILNGGQPHYHYIMSLE